MMNDLYKNILNTLKETPTPNRDKDDHTLIVDGLNTFIRSWTVTPTMNENGDHMGGVTGFLTSVGFAIQKVNPTKLIIVFDGKDGNKRRSKVYTNYKSNRGKNRFRVNRAYEGMMNEEEEHESMKRQMLQLVDILDQLPLITMVFNGIEADDVIAHIATQVITDDKKITIMSSDEDFIQLVNKNTTVWSPTKKILYDINTVYEKFGLYPQNFLIYKILNGDKSDNIEGIQGIGLKTLLKRFPFMGNEEKQTIEDLIDYSNNVDKKLGVYTSIVENKEVLYRNNTLMQLYEPDIGTHNKLGIQNRFNEDVKRLNKFDFFKILNNYKILQNWHGDINAWYKKTFDTLVI